MLKVAAETFEITPSEDADPHSETKNTVGKVFSPLKTTVFLFDNGKKRICMVTSHWLGAHYYRFSNILRRKLSLALYIPFENVIVFGSHNECSTALTTRWRIPGVVEKDLFISERELTPEGLAFLDNAVRIADSLPGKAENCSVHFGTGREERITHNCKGRRSDGTTYMIREQDRRKLGEDYRGDIDPDAPVIAFENKKGSRVAFLTQFTGHPVTAYAPEEPVVFGEYPQVACDELSSAYGGVPAGFLQGCAADIFSRGHHSGKPIEKAVSDSEYLGRCLGETFVKTSRNLRPSERDDALELEWEWVRMPFKAVPSEGKLRSDLKEIERFLELCAMGNEEKTRSCAGLNFPLTMSPHYRTALIAPVRKWTEWALRFHTESRVDESPKHIEIPVTAIRLGDAGIAGLACEPFMNIGRQIKIESPGFSIPCGYTNDTTVVNVPDSQNNSDREFMSATYRYTTTMLEYEQPAGDLLAKAAVRMLRRMA